MSAKNFKIVSHVWYPKRNVPFRIVFGEKGISVDEDHALTGSEVPTYTCFKKVKPVPIQNSIPRVNNTIKENKMSDERLKVFCPYCKKEVECFIKSGLDSLGINYFKGQCEKCEKDIYVEDRRSYEQSGEIEIVLC